MASVKMILIEKAEGKVKEIYKEIKKVLRVSVVADFHRSLKKVKKTLPSNQPDDFFSWIVRFLNLGIIQKFVG